MPKESSKNPSKQGGVPSGEGSSTQGHYEETYGEVSHFVKRACNLRASEEMEGNEENIERTLCASEFLPLGRKGKIIISSSNPSCHSDALISNKRRDIKTLPSFLEFDYLTCSCKVLKRRIVRYNLKSYEVPKKVLNYSYSLSRFHLEAYVFYYIVCSPYIARSALENECHFFPGEGEVGVYLGHLMAGLCFHVDPDLLEILKFHDLPLCRYSLVSIGCMVAFLSLLQWKRIPFS